VAEGHGAAALKTQVLSSIESNLTSLPAAYANCVDAKAKAMSNGQLATILQAGENGQTALHNAGVAIGRQYGNECLGNPAALAEMRALFLKPIRQSVSQYSPAFASCLLSEAEALPSNTLRSLILNPSTASAKSAALGKGWAQKCVQKGIKP
jgi:hypothetical protein